jgi:hypothetical protein
MVKTNLPYGIVVSTITLLELANQTVQIRPGVFGLGR